MEFDDINGKDKSLYKHYLNNRYQIFSLNDKKYKSTALSKLSEIKHCVQQGSILGRLLFLLHINDLPETMNKESLPIIFAD
jgi:hypothetical protein